MRQRRPGVWEIRVVVGSEPTTGRSVQRSFTFHGDQVEAERYRGEIVSAYGSKPPVPVGEGERLPVQDLLQRFLEASHRWSPATWASHRSVALWLIRDPIGRVQTVQLSPAKMERAIVGWLANGATASVVSGRFRVLHSALTWAMSERLIRFDPLAGMPGPRRPYPRKHLPPDLVRQLLDHADRLADKARVECEEHPSSRSAMLRLFRAERDALLVRLTADTGARRGELSGLRVEDLDGRVLTIERAVAGNRVGPTKTHQCRRLTVGPTLARQWAAFVQTWHTSNREPSKAGWLFTATPISYRPMSPSALGHAFHRLCHATGLPEATLHRLRHTVGTVLVSNGKLLKASARLGHRDPSTTLRHYADALPLDDHDAANLLDTLYR